MFLYEEFITPGLMVMIQLFAGMQASLSMVYDRETLGNMRVLLVSPFPRGFLLVSKLLASTVVSVLQVYAFLAVALAVGDPTSHHRVISPCCRRSSSAG